MGFDGKVSETGFLGVWFWLSWHPVWLWAWYQQLCRAAACCTQWPTTSFRPRSGSKKWAFQQLLRPVRQCHTRLHTSCMITFRPPNYKASFVGATISFLFMSCRLIIDTTWWNAKESPRSEHPFWLISTLYNVGVRPLLAPLFSPASLRKHCTGNQCHHQLHKHPYAWSRRRIPTPRAPTFPVSSSPAAITNQPKPAKCLVSFSAP